MFVNERLRRFPASKFEWRSDNSSPHRRDKNKNKSRSVIVKELLKIWEKRSSRSRTSGWSGLTSGLICSSRRLKNKWGLKSRKMSGKAEGGSYKSLKILAVGDVKGRISDLVKRLKTVNKKAGPFDMVRYLLPQFLQFLVYAEITRDLACECSSLCMGWLNMYTANAGRWPLPA